MAIYVKPQDEARQCDHCGGVVNPQWVVVDSDGETEIAGPFDTRNEAKLDAVDQCAGDAVVLLRADGSIYGELRPEDPAKRDRISADEQVVDGDVARDGGK